MSAPAGWYPDPTDPTRELWWDGVGWTTHQRAAATAVPAAPAYSAAPAYAAAPAYSAAPAYAAAHAYVVPPKAQVDTNTVWVWLAIAASLLPFAVLFFIDWDGYVNAVLNASRYDDPTGILQWEMRLIGVSLIGTALLGLFVVFSWLDWRELRRRGVPRPFHWGWSFFAFVSGGLAVYMIGRAVVLGRRTVAGGWAPLWVWIGVTVLGYVVTIAWTINMVSTMISQLGSVYS
ncbi:MAG: hypothetical protein ABS62_04100 [Microbacterium sp. SCN 70-200]|uniref:DUF2510 domain-containing protein n=1 Tax=unclassified Microbacterium TaxID=2609290 RepID=UPI00086BCC58|nr:MULTISPECIES: DUF2510 domain-containing protein [unclassified Microbacterium]MBN9213592.1 DUF2510 domain-containing protein [Microbacterium sp.]ODT42256.1 MAG: hypothetical protein ABS62_04100 [Microbacterium sp. SCN 70-200]OJV79115.1 MAG: hypothetical protein BGO46_02240 [Microbacterium sp. 70-16]